MLYLQAGITQKMKSHDQKGHYVRVNVIATRRTGAVQNADFQYDERFEVSK